MNVFIACLSIDFINDRLSRKIRGIINKYDFPVQVVNKPARTLKQVVSIKEKRRHENCEVCAQLPITYSCSDRYIVYKFTCKACDERYIGETSRPLIVRYKEHRQSLVKENCVSALSEHALKKHAWNNPKIDRFALDVLAKCRTPVEARLTEATMIDTLRPEINRKHEKG